MPELVSVILTTFNQLQFLRATVASVFAQTYADWELIITDDGSDADTKRYLATLPKRPQVQVFFLEHTGNLSTVRNTALKQARGKYVAFLDSDDLWVPGKLEKQIAALESHPDCRWSFSAFVEIDAHDRPLRRPTLRQWKALQGAAFQQVVTTEAYVRTPSVVVADRSLVMQLGAFDERLHSGGEDYDLYMRLALAGNLITVTEPLVQVRVHAGSHSHTGNHWEAGYAGRDYSLQKLQQSTDPKWHPLLRRERARNAFTLARAHAVSGQTKKSWQALVHSVAYSWKYAEWWWGGAKAIGRSYVPKRAVDYYRRQRETRVQIGGR